MAGRRGSNIGRFLWFGSRTPIAALIRQGNRAGIDRGARAFAAAIRAAIRYSILDREFYIPDPSQLAAQSSVNNQGRGEVLSGAESLRVLEMLKSDANTAYDHYEEMLATTDQYGEAQQGLARELARMNLPANIYTQWYWKVDLHNLFHFLRLRADPHAQYEIRVYAEAIASITADWVPLAYAAFQDYRLGGVSLSAKAVEVLKRRLAGEVVEQADSGMSKGEWREFAGVWG